MTDMTTNAPDTASGFTLIEVLVAFTIAALTLGALSQVFSTGIGAVTRANSEKEALLIAQSSLEELGIGKTLRPTDETDRVEDKYTRRLVVRPRSERLPDMRGGPQPVVYEAEITISWQEMLQTRSISLQTMRLAY
jgi:general secretion pathway protein I